MEYNIIEHKGQPVTQPITQETRPKKKAITQATPVKKNVWVRAFNSLVNEEDTHNLKNVLLQEVVVPAVKSIILDVVTTGITTALYGRNAPQQSRTTQGYRNTGRTNYQAAYQPTQTTTRTQPKSYDSGRDGRTYVNEYVIANRHEAVMILDELKNSISMYGSVSVADYYDLIGHDGNYTDHNYGWIDLSRVNITGTRGGYLLHLPAVEAI